MQEGSLSDGRYAELYARSRVEKGFGPLRIEYELRQWGIDETLILEALSGYATGWSSRAAAVRRKRFGDPLPKDGRERARQFRFLHNRGFTSEQVRALLDARNPDVE